MMLLIPAKADEEREAVAAAWERGRHRRTPPQSPDPRHSPRKSVRMSADLPWEPRASPDPAPVRSKLMERNRRRNALMARGFASQGSGPPGSVQFSNRRPGMRWNS